MVHSARTKAHMENMRVTTERRETNRAKNPRIGGSGGGGGAMSCGSCWRLTEWRRGVSRDGPKLAR